MAVIQLWSDMATIQFLSDMATKQLWSDKLQYNFDLICYTTIMSWYATIQ